MYHNKYLKYKQKYLNLIGGVDEFDQIIKQIAKPEALSNVFKQVIPSMLDIINGEVFEIYISFTGEISSTTPEENNEGFHMSYMTSINTSLDKQKLPNLGINNFNYNQKQNTDNWNDPIKVTDINLQRYLFKLSSIYFIEKLYHSATLDTIYIINVILFKFNNEFDRLFSENLPSKILIHHINPILLK